MQAYCCYTKAIDFLVFSGFFWKPKTSKVSLRSRLQSYELNMFEIGWKGGNFGGARRLLLLLLCSVLQPFFGPVSFSENQRHLELDIFENGWLDGYFGGARRPLRLLFGNVLQPICGPIAFTPKFSIFSFSVGFSENQRHVELVLDLGDKVMSSIYFKRGEKAVISE